MSRKRKGKKRVGLWLAAVGIATVAIFPYEVWKAIQQAKKALEKEKEELSKKAT